MVDPIINQLEPILMPERENTLRVSEVDSNKKWAYFKLPDSKDPISSVAEINGGFRWAQAYSERLFFMPDADNKYQLVWNRKEDAWMVQSWASCDENGDESDSTTNCVNNCDPEVVAASALAGIRRSSSGLDGVSIAKSSGKKWLSRSKPDIAAKSPSFIEIDSYKTTSRDHRNTPAVAQKSALLR